MCPCSGAAVVINVSRYEVYICTAAQRAYAEVAWTLLDPRESLFPFEELSWRLLTVPALQHKDLLNVLRACSPPTPLLTDAGEGGAAQHAATCSCLAGWLSGR